MSRVAKFVEVTKRLIDLERAEEIHQQNALSAGTSEKELEASGRCLSRLAVADLSTGLYGRTLVTFEVCCAQRDLQRRTEFDDVTM